MIERSEFDKALADLRRQMEKQVAEAIDMSDQKRGIDLGNMTMLCEHVTRNTNDIKRLSSEQEALVRKAEQAIKNVDTRNDADFKILKERIDYVKNAAEALEDRNPSTESIKAARDDIARINARISLVEHALNEINTSVKETRNMVTLENEAAETAADAERVAKAAKAAVDETAKVAAEALSATREIAQNLTLLRQTLDDLRSDMRSEIARRGAEMQKLADGVKAGFDHQHVAIASNANALAELQNQVAKGITDKRLDPVLADFPDIKKMLKERAGAAT